MKKLLTLVFLSLFMFSTFNVDTKRPKKRKPTKSNVKVQCNNDNSKFKIKRYKTSKRGGTKVGSFK